MFPNVRLMAASALVSVMALFFAFGVYASLRVSHEPLARSSRAAPLQLVGFNVAMLPITVLAPFADKHAAPAVADNGSVLAYSARQVAAPQAAPPVAGAPDPRGENAAVDEPAENNDVTQMQISEAVEAAREIKPPTTTIQESVDRPGTAAQSAADAAPPASPPPAAAARLDASPAASPPAPAAPQVSPVEQTATIETMPTAAEEFTAALADDAADTDIVPKKKKKKRVVVRRHFYRAPIRAVAQSSTTPTQSTSWPAAIGGPLVTPSKH